MNNTSTYSVKEINNRIHTREPFKNTIFLKIVNKSAAAITYNLGNSNGTLNPNEEDVFPSYCAPSTGDINFKFGAGDIRVRIIKIELNDE